MADESSQIMEHATERKPKKKGKGKARTIKVTVEFDQDAVSESVTELLGRISDLVR